MSHIAGIRHKKIAEGANTRFYCPLCARGVGAIHSWRSHVASKGHHNQALRQGVSPSVQPEIEAPGEASCPSVEYCGLCSKEVPKTAWQRHLANPKHLNKVKFARFKALIDEATKDKHGVTVSDKDDGLDLGIISSAEAASGFRAHLTMQATVPLSKISIVDIKLTSRNAHSSFSVDSASLLDQMLVCRRDYTIPVTFRSSYAGHYEDRVEITLEEKQLKQAFVIVRFVRVIVGDKADYDRLKPTMPYTPRVHSKREPEITVVPGEAPPVLKAIPYVVKLADAHIPKNIMAVVSTGSNEDKVNNLRRSILPRVLDVASHGRHFKTLLWVEEKRSDLAVPGLAEKRPSVLVGDRILVQRHGSEKGHWYEGHVHFVHRDYVGLRFHGSFPGHNAAQLYNVRFKLNRIPLRRQHQALDAAIRGEHLFFPSASHIAGFAAATQPFTPYNTIIASNPSQMQAIRSIMSMKPVSVPFVVFGPYVCGLHLSAFPKPIHVSRPGTGKTVTMVEAIRQVLKYNPDARILACAPSNSAADLIASRLTMYGKHQLLRYYAPSRSKNDVPDDLQEFTYETNVELGVGREFERNRFFSVPPMAVLKRYKIMVSTCVSASVAYNVGMPRGHFTHIFIDEAGQATEPEAMISIKAMANDQTKVILSGDPKQLGPIIRSPVARELGLDTSYLERLMTRDIYLEDSPNVGKSFVKLVKNFRSHGAILKFPNEQFYRGDLEVCGKPQVITSYLQWSHLPKKDFPIIFHGVQGKDDRESTSPSFFNISEALLVKDYINKLRDDRRIRIAHTDIGVITPYHAQCLKIRAALRGVADEVKVGSTEEFQGQERRVIIISTVRSSKEYVNYDLKHTLGFVANPRRFNVAVTRAQALLIVIGDPTVLSLDPLWRSFLNYIYLKGGWRGPQPTWDPKAEVRSEGGYDKEMRELAMSDMNEFAQRLESVAGANAAGEDGGPDVDADVNVDRPWREVE
ncbi:P-loop containing nucleoside triphosphate hydrolase protein [Gloeophyllum trabeum ATCC 11539]|uniref:RNA helicase n=1 Tax=Gloeophyllum trabeum (strain ATCC 11539 / FP-39264 / Madison 617) TaxID=670483 RepID=S7Q183_GLOTA|nr:P-loop containing nucleoside triphosphate hydrolase protein [Gloeophyllum trabeum ATCC 11539]EPQ53711.1 P-loop containing nucleoside triphosphate hydrolase protein [Gloeophyllum trabeum ATCC 11539]